MRLGAAAVAWQLQGSAGASQQAMLGSLLQGTGCHFQSDL